jgi:uracil-DNA glycosylase family 4
MDKLKKLKALKKKMQGDKSLPLRKDANNLVFGEGNVDADILMIGEGPGYWEDRKGRPFVGNAGAFLNQLCDRIELSRKEGLYEGEDSEYFITNVVHYRPPNNRDPKDEEIKAFGAYLDKIISIIDPKVIVTLGRFSMGKFIPNTRISTIHGRPHKKDWNGKEILVVPMYHPAAGLRNPEVKRKTMDDFMKLPDILKGAENNETEEGEKEKVEQMSLV